MKPPIRTGAAVMLAVAAQVAAAQTPAEYLNAIERTARADTPAFGGFSAARGRAFFDRRHGSDWSCSTCHTPDPLAEGKHARTGRAIAPMAPSANPQRFTDAAKAEKWFKRNCRDVLGRECTPIEKGDVVAYLTSLTR